MSETQQQNSISVLGQFIKDLSLEIPHAPEIFAEVKSAPKIEVNVDVQSENKGNDRYTSTLHIVINGKTEEKTLFILELSYMAFANVKAPAELLEQILLIELPRMIFPFARSVITQCLCEGGLPPFMLNPIDFAALYAARKQSQQAQKN